MTGLSPTQLSIRYLRTEGYTVEIVERWNPHTRTRHDLFGVLDLLALRGAETLGVQTTSNGNVAARVRKIAESQHIAALREAGWTLHVHGWRKNKSNRWELRTVDVS